MADDTAAAATTDGQSGQPAAAAATAPPAAGSLVDTVPQAKADPAAAPDGTAWMSTAVPNEFLGGKYKTLGDVEKGFKELQRVHTETQGKLKAFAGAPDKYDIAMPEALVGKLEWKSDDPLLGEFQKLCKENGVSQEFFGKVLGVFAQYEAMNLVPDWAAEKTLIGDRADDRIKSVTEWYGANLDSESADLIKTALSPNPSPGQVFLALERIISGKRQAPLPKPGDDVASTPTVAELDAKYRTKDPNTKRALIDTPEGLAEYRAQLGRVVGNGEHRVVVGRQ